MRYTLTSVEAAMYDSGDESLDALRQSLLDRFGVGHVAEVVHPDGFTIVTLTALLRGLT